MHRPWLRPWLAVAVVSALSIGCSSPPARPAPVPPAPRPAPPVTAPAPKPAAPTKATFPGAPETVAGEHLAWVLDALANRQGVITRAEVDRRFHPSMLAQVPADKLVATLAEIAKQLVGFKLLSVKGSEHGLVAILDLPANGRLQVLVHVDRTTKQMTGLLLKPDAADAPRPTTFAEAVTMTTQLAPKAQLLVASLDRGRCKPLHRTKSTEALAIGSTAKLYILLGLADRILAGKAQWTDELAVRDDWKSLPSGITQNDAAGTKHPLRLYADRMVAISDNTATDHLLYTLGRKPVEAAVRATKHKRTAKNVPFMGTRELFLFKLAMTDEELASYRKLPEARRRAYLDETLADKIPDITKAEGWESGRRIEEAEWFASADDLCGLMGTLWQRAQKPGAAPVLEVLAKNPGLDIDKMAFPYIGFKGGSEPGVINLTWLVRRSDEQWFVVALTANSPAGKVEESAAMGIALGVFDVLGKAAKPKPQ